MKLNELTAHEIADLYKSNKTTPQHVYDEVMGQIHNHDKKVNAYLRLHKQPALSGYKQNSWPIPMGIKDNMCIDGEETTCASKILKGFVSPYDATVIKKLREAGVIFTGNTNMDEFAFGSSTENHVQHLRPSLSLQVFVKRVVLKTGQ